MSTNEIVIPDKYKLHCLCRDKRETVATDNGDRRFEFILNHGVALYDTIQYNKFISISQQRFFNTNLQQIRDEKKNN